MVFIIIILLFFCFVFVLFFVLVYQQIQAVIYPQNWEWLKSALSPIASTDAYKSSFFPQTISDLEFSLHELCGCSITALVRARPPLPG